MIDDFDKWLEELEEMDQPEACNLDDPDECEACGS